MHVYCCGGAGMLGSHLVDLLLARGHDVTILDNLSRGKNLPITTGGWNVCLQDLTQHCPDFERHSVVFHLAAKVTGIAHNMNHSYEMQTVNDAINYHALEAVRRSNPRLLIAASTVCIYNPDVPIPTPEWCGEVGNPEKSNWGYGVSKWAMEQRCKSLCLEYGIPTIVVRPSNMAGQRDYYDEESSHVIPALIKRILDGENPVVVWGTGNQTRSFLDPKDAAWALLDLMDWGLEERPKNPVILNVGNSNEISIRNLVHHLIRLCVETGLPVWPDVEYDLTKPDGYKRRGSDTTAIKELVGWEPKRPLETTLREMIADYRRRFQTG